MTLSSPWWGGPGRQEVRRTAAELSLETAVVVHVLTVFEQNSNVE